MVVHVYVITINTGWFMFVSLLLTHAGSCLCHYCYRGRTYAKKVRFLRKKRAGYANLKMPCVYCTQKNSDLTHQNAFSLFVLFHPAEKVCRALAVGLNILDFPRPLPSPSHPGERCWCLRYDVHDTHRH